MNDDPSSRSEHEATATNIQLSVEVDKAWIEQFGLEPRPVVLARLQRDLDADVPDLGDPEGHGDYAAAVAARRSFLVQLGVPSVLKQLDSSTASINVFKNGTLIPLTTVVGVLRALSTVEDLDLRHFIQRSPITLTRSEAHVYQDIATLTRFTENYHGRSVGRMLNTAPTLVISSLRDIWKMGSMFEEMGVDVKKVINRDPFVFSERLDAVQEKLGIIGRYGINLVNLLEKSCNCLRNSPQALSQTLDTLSILQLSPEQIVDNELLRFSASTIRENVRLLERLQHALHWEGDVYQLIRHFPKILVYKKQRMLLLARFAAEHGPTTWHQAANNSVEILIKAAADVHLVAVDLAREQGKAYNLGRISDTRQIFKDRQMRAKEIIADPSRARFIGGKLLRRYIAYSPDVLPNGMSPEKYLAGVFST